METTTRKEGKSRTGKAIVTDRVGVFVNLGSMAPDEVFTRITDDIVLVNPIGSR